MAQFREQKIRLKSLLAEDNWKKTLDDMIRDGESARIVLNPLLALLARPELRWQAAYGLGLAVPLMADDAMESARVLMRRLMWSLNEESGNVGWGIPEAMACILANSPARSKEYIRIFISYGYETGKEDNFIDYAPLRRGVYWGMGRIAQKDPANAAAALPHLGAALGDDDTIIRGLASWALGCLAQGMRDSMDHQASLAWQESRQALVKAAECEKALDQRVELFDGKKISTIAMRSLYNTALDAVNALLAGHA